MNNTVCPKKRYMSKYRDLKMAKICQKDVETISKDFLNSDVLFSHINHFQSSKILHLMIFGDT